MPKTAAKAVNAVAGGVAAFLLGQRELKKTPRSEKNVTKKSLETVDGDRISSCLRGDLFCFIATIDEDWRKRGCKYVY